MERGAAVVYANNVAAMTVLMQLPFQGYSAFAVSMSD